MSNISVIPTGSGIIIESRIPVDQGFINKIENPENYQKIGEHLKDMHCEHYTEEDDCRTPISVLRQWLYEPMPIVRFETLIKVMRTNHDSFIENVNLRMKEVIQFSKDEKKNNEEDEKLQAATEILKAIEEMNDSDPIVFGTTVAIFMNAIGHVKCGFLKEILDTYIDKHLANENNK